MDLKFYFALFLRRLPYFLILLAFGTAIGATLAYVLPPVYVAQARLLSEAAQIPGNLAASTVQTQASEQIQIIQQRILTRANLLELANRLKVYAPVPGSVAPALSADEIVEDMRTRTQIVTTGGTVTRGPAQATILTVSFSAPTGAMAAAVTNELVTMILNENVAMRTAVSGQTLDFFVQEVERLDKELAVRNARILEFTQKNQNALPDSLTFRRTQQVAEQDRLRILDRDEAALRDRRAQLVQLYEATGQVSLAIPAQNMTPEQKQLQLLRDQLAQALLIYSPQNPRVKLLEAQVAAAEKAVAGQGAVNAGGQPLSAYDLQLADIDSQLASIADQKQQVTALLEDLRISIEATQGNAITLDTLNRDYANIRAQYDQAVANKAQAETGDLIEALSKGQRISIIEQAVAPAAPESPNRPMIAAAGVGGGMAFGLGAVLLLELMNRSIRRPADLTKGLGITPFATVPLMRTKGQSRRRSLLILLAFLVVLAGIPLALWAVDTYYQPLDLLLDRLVGKLGLDPVVESLRQLFGW